MFDLIMIRLRNSSLYNCSLLGVVLLNHVQHARHSKRSKYAESVVQRMRRCILMENYPPLAWAEAHPAKALKESSCDVKSH